VLLHELASVFIV